MILKIKRFFFTIIFCLRQFFKKIYFHKIERFYWQRDFYLVLSTVIYELAIKFWAFLKRDWSMKLENLRLTKIDRENLELFCTHERLFFDTEKSPFAWKEDEDKKNSLVVQKWPPPAVLEKLHLHYFRSPLNYHLLTQFGTCFIGKQMLKIR